VTFAIERPRFGGMVLAALLVVLVVAGCGKSKNEAVDETTITTPDRVTTVTNYSIAPGMATDGYAGARSDIGNFTCTKSRDAWTATGTVTNPTAALAAYRVYVSFVDSQDRALGVVQTELPNVALGVATPWTATAAITGTDLTCILRVERVVA